MTPQTVGLSPASPTSRPALAVESRAPINGAADCGSASAEQAALADDCEGRHGRDGAGIRAGSATYCRAGLMPHLHHAPAVAAEAGTYSEA